MKYVHDGVEYDVSDLRLAVRESAKAELLDNHPHTARCLSAAAALIARHERVCEALESVEWSALPAMRGPQVHRCPLCLGLKPYHDGPQADARFGHIAGCKLSAALRGEEAPRG